MISSPGKKKVAFAFLAIMLGLLTILILAELFVRYKNPSFNIQIFRESHHLTIEESEFGLSWKPNEDRLWAGCPSKSASPKMILQGSSILYSSTTDLENGFSLEFQKRLQEKTGQESCVINQAVPGFTFSTQLAVLNNLEPEIKADYLIWEIWANSPNIFIKAGDSAYNFGSKDPNYIPDPFRLGGLGRMLLSTSRIYEWLILSNFKGVNDGNEKSVWKRFTQQALPKMIAEAETREAELRLVFFTNASEPFEKQIKSEENNYGFLAEAAQEKGIPTLFLSQVLEEDSRANYFADQCCHFSEWGVDEVSRIIVDWTLQQNTSTPP